MNDRHPPHYYAFYLGMGYYVGRELSHQIDPLMEGRMAGVPHDYGVLAEAVYSSGGGTWVDIGVLYGGSAILIARVMQFFNLPGRVLAVDPLNGYYGKPIEPPVSRETFERNALACGVGDRIHTIAKKSVPWPIEGRIDGAYIDGEHSGEAPRIDFENVEKAGARWVVFDNYDLGNDGVRPAVIRAASRESWNLVHLSGITAVLKKNE